MLGFIFDCDGTLVDSEEAHCLSWQKTFHNRGLTLPVEAYCKLVGNPGHIVAEKLGISQDSVPEKNAIYAEMQKRGLSPIQRTVDFVRQLKGYKLAVASAAPREEILHNLKSIGLDDVFDVIVSGSDDLADYHDPEGVNKPKPYIYLKAAKLLGLEPKSCIAFEDSLPGVLAASRAGVFTVAVPNAYTLHHNFSQAAKVVDPKEELFVGDYL